MSPRQRILVLSGVALIALTVWVGTLVAWRLLRPLPAAPAPAPVGVPTDQLPATDRVLNVLAANRLLLEQSGEIQLGSIEVPAEGEPFAQEGRLAGQALVEGQAVTLGGRGDAAYVYLDDGRLLQELLVAGGYARVAPDAPEDDALPLLLAAENEARANNLGLWRDGGLSMPVATVVGGEIPPAPIACEATLVPGPTIGPAEAASHLGEDVNVVFYPVRATEENGDVTLLAGLTPDQFGLVIPAGLAGTMDQPALRYLNRCLVVTGRLRQSVDGAPRIWLFALDDLLPLN